MPKHLLTLRASATQALREAKVSRSRSMAVIAGALFLAIAPTGAMAGPLWTPPHKPSPKAPTDVPAPPVALLFGMGALGLLWGRRLGNRRDRY